MASTSKYPERFGKTGKKMWDEITRNNTLSYPEQVILTQVCRCSDRLDEIQAEMTGQSLLVESKGQFVTNPLMVEFRMQSQLLTKMIAQLRIPDEVADDVPRPQRRGGARGSYATNPVHLSVVA